MTEKWNDVERCFEGGRFMASLDDGDKGHPFDAVCPRCEEVYANAN